MIWYSDVITEPLLAIVITCSLYMCCVQHSTPSLWYDICMSYRIICVHHHMEHDYMSNWLAAALWLVSYMDARMIRYYVCWFIYYGIWYDDIHIWNDHIIDNHHDWYHNHGMIIIHSLTIGRIGLYGKHVLWIVTIGMPSWTMGIIML
jgi:hypothetical protein